jgi:hypothetical protein
MVAGATAAGAAGTEATSAADVIEQIVPTSITPKYFEIMRFMAGLLFFPTSSL